MATAVDTTTPRRFVEAFLDAAHRDDWASASALLGPASGARTNQQAVDRAKQLEYLVEHRSWISLDSISDDPKGTPEDGENVERIGVVRVEGGEFPLLLERSRTTPAHWSFSSETLARVPAVYIERGPSWLETHVPTSLRSTEVLGLQAWQAIGLPLAIVVAVVVGRAVAFAMRAIGRPIARRTAFLWDDEMVESSYRPGRLLLTCLVLGPLTFSLGLPGWLNVTMRHVLLTLFIASLVWLALRAVSVLANSLERRTLRERATEPGLNLLHMRGIRTQVQVLRRVAAVLLLTIGGALILTQFEAVRSAGVSLLASAGVAGVVLGLAAQRTIGSVLAGIQLSATQPIRIGDTIVIEGETGTIEEITLTYAVLKIWDERRLVVPITRFLEQPFQNHTKVPSGQIGAIHLYASYTLPVDQLRKELDRILAVEPKWDSRTKAVQVTEAKERCIEVRILVSSADPGTTFDLRASVREKLVAWLQKLDGGRHLPSLHVTPDTDLRPPLRATASA